MCSGYVFCIPVKVLLILRRTVFTILVTELVFPSGYGSDYFFQGVCVICSDLCGISTCQIHVLCSQRDHRYLFFVFL